jgi:hypothetical protein
MALTDFFLSTEKAVTKIGAKGVPDSLPRFQTKDFHVVQLERLGEMLGSGGGVDDGEPIVHGDDFEWMVMGVSDPLVRAMASLSDDDAKKHGMAIARTDELHWPATDGIKVLLELRELAKHAKDGTRLWVWVST